MSRRKDPLDIAVDVLWGWGKVKHHRLYKIKRMDEQTLTTKCKACKREFYISMTENGVVMELDDRTCTRRETVDDEQRSL